MSDADGVGLEGCLSCLSVIRKSSGTTFRVARNRGSGVNAGAHVTMSHTSFTLGVMSNVGEDLLESRRRRRRGGDPRITPEGREALRRLVAGDLMDQFQAGLDQDADSDPALSGSEPLGTVRNFVQGL